MEEKLKNFTPDNYFRRAVECEEEVEDPRFGELPRHKKKFVIVKKTKPFCSILGLECDHSKHSSYGDCRRCVFASAYLSENQGKIIWKEIE